MRDYTRYLDGTRDLWLEQANPVWVWLAIKSSNHNKHPYPQWVCEYLEKMSDRLLADDVHGDDFARKLPSILGFRAKRGPKHPLTIFKRMLKNEQFAMKFAKHILAGKKPSTARQDAANECARYWQNADDKVLQAALREHFKLKRLPAGTLALQQIVLNWLIANPLYCKRYPDLPALQEIMELAAISRNSTVTN